MSTTTNEHDTICSTKKGREDCVARIKVLATENGATIQLHEFNGPREIGLDVCFGPYRCMMHFNGGSRVGAFLGHWHIEHKSLAKYPVTFGADIRGTINAFHYSKATAYEDTFEGFLHSLKSGLESLAIEMAEDSAEAVAS